MKRRLLLIAGALLLLVGGFAAYTVYNTWGDVQRVEIDRTAMAQSVEEPTEEPSDPDEEDNEVEEPAVVQPGRQVFLLVGSDSRAELEDTEDFGDFGGSRADVVMVLFKDSSDTALLSLPRDLLITNPCTGREVKLNATLEGCSDMNGPTLLMLTVEEIIDHPIDHFALVDLEGFQHAVDALGGYEICVDNPVRDEKAGLELPAGCTNADGAQTLAWMRSRSTQELTSNGWRTMAGMSDLARNERQRSFMIDVMGRIGDITSPAAMSSAGQAVAPYVTVDSDLSFGEAVDLALTLRGRGLDNIVELSVPVYDVTTSAGAAALLPSTPVAEIVDGYLATLGTTAEAVSRQ